jgi:SAM-dependent methyltransferase
MQHQDLILYGMSDAIRRHYEEYPYPHYPLIASLARCDTYALNLDALWARCNGELPVLENRRILIAGCGSFAPYPFSVANPEVSITALDLSRRSLGRARQHCLLHGRRNVTFQTGDLLDTTLAPGPFGLIDVYGVLHHLADPLAGLRAMAARLSPGGILRVMLYSRYARREEESIRRALRLLKVHDPATVKRLIARSKPDSRLQRYAVSSPEAGFAAGLADALLHPLVHTFRVGEVLELIKGSGLELLFFAHNGALADTTLEVERIRRMETKKESPGNFVFFLGRNPAGPCRDEEASFLLLNPCLRDAVSRLRLGTIRIPGRHGHANPPLGCSERAFLRRFIRPAPWSALSADDRAEAAVYIQALFLLQYRG